jgi:hypothetical protein
VTFAMALTTTTGRGPPAALVMIWPTRSIARVLHGSPADFMTIGGDVFAAER